MPSKQNSNPLGIDSKNADIDYKDVFAKMINGFALHKIILNDQDKPVNYQFVDVNPAFEKSVGIKKEKIIGRTVIEVIPGTEKDPANWISKYGEVALTGKAIEFENYSEAIKKWFHVSAYSPKKGYFVTISEDISARKQAELDLQAKNDELEKVFKNVVGREAKMIEMKKEIDELKRRIK